MAEQDQQQADGATETDKAGQAAPAETQDRENDGQEYLDRDQLDFDPDDGLLSGTAVDGDSKIPGPHEADGYSERGDKVELGENADVDAKDDAGGESAEGADEATAQS